MTATIPGARIDGQHGPTVTTVAAASLALRGVVGPRFTIRESVNGPRFPNGYVPSEFTPSHGQPRELIVARRWWDPRARTETLDSERVDRFVRSTRPVALPRAPEASIGWGPGLTPAGDDVVVGMLIAYHTMGMASTARDLAAVLVGQETTPLSRSLLDHAARAEAVRPLLDLMRALAGRGHLERALATLRRFGATSGVHLIDGVRRALTS